MTTKKKITAGLLALTMAISSMMLNVKTAQAAEYWPDNVSTVSRAAIVMEQETGVILYEKNIHATYYPASITKILTALVALENSQLDEIVTFSKDAVYKNEGDTSHISRDVGEQMTMEQCLYGMMLESANECAYAIAEHVGDGDVNKFVDMMNEKARELGCVDSNFNNTNGLPDENHYVSAYDMALISRAAYANEDFARIVGTKTYSIPPTNKHTEITPLYNHHAMLHAFRGYGSRYVSSYCLGGKTGYTVAANSTLVTYARKNGMTLVCVVLNATSPGHYVDTKALLNYCFDNFTVYNVAEQEGLFTGGSGNTAGILGEDIDLVEVDPDGVVILPVTAELSDAAVTVMPMENSKDTSVVGQVQYTYAGHYVGGANLIFQQQETESYPFHNLPAEQGGSSIKSIHIDVKQILLFLVLILAAGVLVLLVLKSFSAARIRRRRRTKSQVKSRSDHNGYKKIKRNRRRKRGGRNVR